MGKLKVTPQVLDEGQRNQFFVLATEEDGEMRVIVTAPNNWKTRKGAIRWAIRNGYDVEE